MSIQLISPADAIVVLRQNGLTFTEISLALNRPTNYASRILAGQIKEPSYVIADKLRALVSDVLNGVDSAVFPKKGVPENE